MTDTRALLKAHTADQVGRLDADYALRALTAAAHNPSTPDPELEQVAVDFIHTWGRHVYLARSARFGQILHTIQHRDDVATHVVDWNRRMYNQGGLSGWYRDHHRPIDKQALLDEYARAVHGLNYDELDDHHKATAWSDVTTWHRRLTARRNAVTAAEGRQQFEDVPLFEVSA